jgi:hypothetical protein
MGRGGQRRGRIESTAPTGARGESKNPKNDDERRARTRAGRVARASGRRLPEARTSLEAAPAQPHRLASATSLRVDAFRPGAGDALVGETPRVAENPRAMRPRTRRSGTSTARRRRESRSRRGRRSVSGRIVASRRARARGRPGDGALRPSRASARSGSLFPSGVRSSSGSGNAAPRGTRQRRADADTHLLDRLGANATHVANLRRVHGADVRGLPRVPRCALEAIARLIFRVREKGLAEFPDCLRT